MTTETVAPNFQRAFDQLAAMVNSGEARLQTWMDRKPKEGSNYGPAFDSDRSDWFSIDVTKTRYMERDCFAAQEAIGAQYQALPNQPSWVVDSKGKRAQAAHIINKDGSESWNLIKPVGKGTKGRRVYHRVNGPAVINADGTSEYWIDGVRVAAPDEDI